MKLDVFLNDPKRTLVACCVVIGATVVACFKVITGELWLMIVGGVWGAFEVRGTIENAVKRSDAKEVALAEVKNGAIYSDKVLAGQGPTARALIENK